MHIVQIGYSAGVFHSASSSDTRERQQRYALELERISPGSRMTYVVLCEANGLQQETIGNLTLLPIHVSSRVHIPRVFLELRKLHQSYPIDVLSPQDVSNWGWTVLAFGRTHGIPVVGQAHYDIFSPAAVKIRYGRGWPGFIHYKITLQLLKQFAALRVDSTSVAHQLEELGLTCPIEGFPIPMPDSVAGSGAAMPADAILDAKPDANLVLFVGRLAAQKDLFTWLRVASLVAERMPEARFRMVGGGPLKDAIASQAASLGISERIEMIGPVPPTELPEHYRQASVFLLTSLFEGLPRVILEAMFAGVVPVASRISGLSETIKHEETGFLHDQQDVTRMAESVERLLVNSSLRRSMALAALNDVRERFDSEQLTRRWVQFLVASGQPARRTIG